MSASSETLGVEIGLEALGDGGDGDGSFAVHEPGHEVGAVAAEVGEGSVSVLGGIGEEGEEVRERRGS